jgi:hypothetical protein
LKKYKNIEKKERKKDVKKYMNFKKSKKKVKLRGDFISESLRVSITEDLSRISLLLERVRLARTPDTRTWEAPNALSSCNKRDLISAIPSPSMS